MNNVLIMLQNEVKKLEEQKDFCALNAGYLESQKLALIQKMHEIDKSIDDLDKQMEIEANKIEGN